MHRRLSDEPKATEKPPATEESGKEQVSKEEKKKEEKSGPRTGQESLWWARVTSFLGGAGLSALIGYYQIATEVTEFSEKVEGSVGWLKLNYAALALKMVVGIVGCGD